MQKFKRWVLHMMNAMSQKIDDLLFEEVEVLVEIKAGKIYRKFKNVKRKRKKTLNYPLHKCGSI